MRRPGRRRSSFLRLLPLRHRLLAASPVHDQNATTHPRQTPPPARSTQSHDINDMR